MKALTRIALTTAALFLFGAASAGAAELPKIGIVNFQKVLATSSPGKIAKAEINKKGKEMEDSLKAKGAELEELKKTIEREALVMSKDKRDEKERDFRIKVNDFKTMQARYKESFKDLENRLISKINRDVLELAHQMGKDEGYVLILEQNAAGVMYFPETLDITDKLITKFNKSSVNTK
ncbi:MAG: OmpH family outer membrane protein [Desulfobacterium sp.]|nr:OmpH family outer membrane protein [Desulfobacterium sp.]